ncbi:MAG: hypothetical protein JWN33_439 [Candidatus Saccharibacteria bacterium]|nr:hypothetical protein [Candidatus Saccharibacteria bacterium]
MNYVETLNDSFGKHQTLAPAPAGIVERALEMRFSRQLDDPMNDAVDQLDLNRLPPEERRLYQFRIIGSIATRLEIASYLTPSLPTFHELSQDEQTAHLMTASRRYSDNLLSDTASRVEETPEEVLTYKKEYDPLVNISHAFARSVIYTSRLKQMSRADRIAMAMSYANVSPGSFPPSPYRVTPMGKNDVVLAQAFGRDSITDSELVSIRDMRQRLGNDDDMMGYLDGTHFIAGPSNDALADEINKQLLSGPAEQIIQWEVAYALWHNHPATYQTYRHYLHILWPHTGFYPTYEVKSDSVAVMDNVGLYNPKELAHKDMMVRALGILNKRGIIADPLVVDVPFDPGSTQPHVRNSKAWVRREALARGEHILRGRVKF